MLPRPRLLHFIILLILFSALGCHKESTSPENDITFVGGPENPASDGTYTSRIYSGKGIASLEEITLGGEQQWILIRGYEVSNPLLVFLHGGPGSACIFYATYAMGGLEKDFVVVTWDQRGSGKSYHENIDPNSLTFEQLYSDAHELVVKMTERFSTDKVYLMGISWGSILGSNIAKNYPGLIRAYIGIGQVVNPVQGLEIAFEAVWNKAQASGDQAAIEELSLIDPDSTWQHMDIISKWVDEYGFGDFHDEIKAQQILGSMASSLTEYSADDISGLEKGKELYSLSPLGSDLTWLKNIDMRTQIPAYNIPVYLLSGKYDYKTPALLVEEYCQDLEAPSGKRIFVFENSAHVPILEERELFQDIMINTVLSETYTGKND